MYKLYFSKHRNIVCIVCYQFGFEVYYNSFNTVTREQEADTMWSLKLAPTFRDNVLWECYISWLSKVIYDQWTLNINKKIVLWNLQRNLIYRSVLFQLICWIEGIEHVLKEQLKPANNSKSDFFYDPIFIRKDKCELFSIRTWV